MQRLARARKSAHVFGLQTFMFRKLLRQILGKPILIAPGISSDFGNGFASRGAWAQGVFIRINDHSIFGKWAARQGSGASRKYEEVLADDSGGKSRRCCSAHCEKRSA